MPKSFLLIGNQPDLAWTATLKEALQPLGQLYFASAADAIRRVEEQAFDMVVIDAGTVDQVADFVRPLRMAGPALLIVVVTASPTWQRARQVILAGANDYIRKSSDAETLLKTFKGILSESAAG